MNEKTDIPVVILAGGLGTRLQPLIGKYPKPMVRIGGKPFLERLVLFYKNHGFRKFVFCTGFGSHYIRNYFSDGAHWDIEAEYAMEEELMGTAGAVKNAEHLIGDASCFILTNGDSFVDFNPRQLVAYHTEEGSDITIVIGKAGDRRRSGNIAVDGSFRILDFNEKSTIHHDDSHINGGIYCFSTRVLDRIPVNTVVSLEHELLPFLIKEQLKITGLPVSGTIIDIGTVESYLSYKDKNFFQERKQDEPVFFQGIYREQQ
jgi:mannose-1-phosphate guanylyltransferase